MGLSIFGWRTKAQAALPMTKNLCLRHGPAQPRKKNEEETEVAQSSEPPKAPKGEKRVAQSSKPPKAPKEEKEVAQLSLLQLLDFLKEFCQMLDSDDAGQTKRILRSQIQKEDSLVRRNALVEEIRNKMEHSTQKCSKEAFKAEVFKRMPDTDEVEMSRILQAYHKMMRQRPEEKTFESAATERSRRRIQQFEELKSIGRFNRRE